DRRGRERALGRARTVGPGDPEPAAGPGARTYHVTLSYERGDPLGARRWTACPAPGQYRLMPKKIAKKDLPSPGDVPTAAPLVERLDKRRGQLVGPRRGGPQESGRGGAQPKN